MSWRRVKAKAGTSLMLLIAAILGTIAAAYQGQDRVTPPIRFEEIAEKSGLRFVLNNEAGGRLRQIELMLGGVAVIDYNNDGCPDLFFTNGAATDSLTKSSPAFYNRLFRNNCNLTFTDVTSDAGLAGEGYSMGAAVADYDNDGLPDLFVAGVNRNTLYRNLGNGRFEDVTKKRG